MGEKYQHFRPKFMYDDLRNYFIAILTKIDFCNMFRKLNSEAKADLELFLLLTPPEMYTYYNIFP